MAGCPLHRWYAALEWIIHQWGVSAIDHYIDDFVKIGVCGHAMGLTVRSCRELEAPLAMDRLEGPSHCCITFLRIEIDVVAGVLQFPPDKLIYLRKALQQWSSQRACKRHELESLIGTLPHVCWVIKPGRSFLHQMIDLLCIPRQSHHHMCLNKHFWLDLQWWRVFASHWMEWQLSP